MNWDTVEGKWEQFKGKTREKWAKLTDDDLESIAGKKDRLFGKIQERYGHKREQVEADFDSWLDNLH